MASVTKQIKGNSFIGSSLQFIGNLGDFSNNSVAYSTLSIDTNTSTITNNKFEQTSVFNLTNNDGLIDSNFCSNSNFTIGSNTGDIKDNSFSQKSTVTIDDNQSNINSITTIHSVFNVAQNLGDIDDNEIVRNSTLSVTSNLAGAVIRFNSISNESSLTIGNNLGRIGTKNTFDGYGSGNIFTDKTTVNITNLTVNAQFFANEIYTSTINIVTLKSNIALCQMKYTEITFDVDSAFSKLNLNGAVYGGVGYSVNQAFGEGEFVKGNGSIKAFLDCSDPLIYDTLTNTLNIPAELRDFAGIYVLNNSNGIQIDKILGMSANVDTTFYNDFGSSTDFTIVAVGSGVAGNIIANTTIPSGLFTMVFRSAGQDYIKLKKLGNLNGMVEYGIFV